MRFEEFLQSFSDLVAGSPTEAIRPGSRFVIMSDLHMGDGGSRDDLAKNRALLRGILRERYLEEDWTLVLAGDVEELHKFKLGAIRRAWQPLYAIIDAFNAKGALRKIVGNHDLALLAEQGYPYGLLHGLSLMYGERRLFCFHGHQSSRFFVKYNYLSDFIVRYLAKPLKIANTSISEDSRQRFKAERRIYKASKKLGIASIAGHTHRPLFESMSKYDSLRYTMEGLLRDHAAADAAGREEIARRLDALRREFEGLRKKDKHYGLVRGLYEERDFVIPCLFNAGCATGKGGITAIEVVAPEQGPSAGTAPADAPTPAASIALVHWAEEGASKEYLEREAIATEALAGTPWVRHVLRREGLDSVFARIDLLGGGPVGEAMERIAF
jgi:UDP-2,3-diacylglucosamine pyrophosphatase LpxH